MHTDVLAILFGLIAGVGWGISGFFDAKASKTIGPLNAALLINLLVAVGYALIYVLFLSGSYPLDTIGIWYAIASGVVITIGALCYFRGLSAGPVSLVSPLSASYPLVTTLVAIVIFSAHLTGTQFAAIIMIKVSVMAASGLFDVKNKATKKLDRGPALALTTAITWGLGYSLASQAIARLGWELASLIEFSVMAMAFGVFIPFIASEKPATKLSIVQGIKNKYVLLAGFISLFAAVALNIGLSREHSSGAIVAALSACYPVLTVILARRHFDEHIGLVPLTGASLSIAGVILLSIGL